MTEEIVKLNTPFIGEYGCTGKEFKLDKSGENQKINLPLLLKKTIEKRQMIDGLESAMLFLGPGEDDIIKYVILTDDIKLLVPLEKFYPIFATKENRTRLTVIKGLEKILEACGVVDRIVYVGKVNHIRIYDYTKYCELKK